MKLSKSSVTTALIIIEDAASARSIGLAFGDRRKPPDPRLAAPELAANEKLLVLVAFV